MTYVSSMITKSYYLHPEVVVQYFAGGSGVECGGKMKGDAVSEKTRRSRGFEFIYATQVLLNC